MTDEIPPEYENLTEKDLLIQQNSLLMAINDKLRALETENESVETVACTVCETELPVDNMKAHGRSCFNWSIGLGVNALEGKFRS